VDGERPPAIFLLWSAYRSGLVDNPLPRRYVKPWRFTNVPEIPTDEPRPIQRVNGPVAWGAALAFLLAIGNLIYTGGFLSAQIQNNKESIKRIEKGSMPRPEIDAKIQAIKDAVSDIKTQNERILLRLDQVVLFPQAPRASSQPNNPMGAP
jgi:hypothetical protein